MTGMTPDHVLIVSIAEDLAKIVRVIQNEQPTDSIAVERALIRYDAYYEAARRKALDAIQTKPRRKKHSRDSTLHCEICAPLECCKAPERSK